MPPDTHDLTDPTDPPALAAALPDPRTLSPAEVGDWVGRMMWAFAPDDERSEFARLLGLRIKEFHAARTLRQAAQAWCDEYDKPVEVGGRPMIVSFGEDGFRVLCFVVDVADPPTSLSEWREVASLSLDLPGGFGSMLAEVIEV